MLSWQRIVVSTQAHVGDPAPLPPWFEDLEGQLDVLADLPAYFLADTLQSIGMADAGFLPIVDPPPPPPPPPRAELPKSTVVARLQAVGKFDAVWAILGSNAALFAKWFSPDWPNVYKDDAGMLQVLAAAGLSAGEIAAVTA